MINDINIEEMIVPLYEKEWPKTNSQEFRTEKVIKKKGDKLSVFMVFMVLIVHLIAGLIKKI